MTMPETLLKVSHLKKYYTLKAGQLFGSKSTVKAVDDISFELQAGQTLGIHHG